MRILIRSFLLAALVIVSGCGLFDETDPYGLARQGKISVLRHLMEKGLDVNEKEGYTKRTLLFGAVQREDTKTAEFLIEKGAAVNVRDKWEGTPLIHAVRYSSEQAVQLLLDHGARVNDQNKDGESALHRAVEKGHLNITRLLLVHGANVNARDENRVTPLHLAVESRSIDLVRILLERGAKVRARTEKGYTPLYWAEETGLREIAALLKKKGARLAKPSPSPANLKKWYQKIIGPGPLRVKRVIKRPTYARKMVFSADGTLAVSTQIPLETPASGNKFEQRGVLIWNAKTWKVQHRLNEDQELFSDKVFSGDGRHLLSNGRKLPVRVWNVEEEKEVRQFGDLPGRVLDFGAVDSRKYVLVGEKNKKDQIDEDKITESFYVDYKDMMGGLKHNLWVYDFETGEKVREIKGYMGEVHQGRFSSDGRFIISLARGRYSDGANLCVWETATGRLNYCTRQIRRVNSFVLLPNGKHMAFVDYQKTYVADIQSGGVVMQFREGGYRLASAGGGRYLVLVRSNRLVLMDIQTGEVALLAVFREEFRKFGKQYNHIERFTALAASPRDHTFLVATNHGKLILFELQKS